MYKVFWNGNVTILKIFTSLTVPKVPKVQPNENASDLLTPSPMKYPLKSDLKCVCVCVCGGGGGGGGVTMKMAAALFIDLIWWGGGGGGGVTMKMAAALFIDLIWLTGDISSI